MTYLVPVGILGGLALLFGAILAIASRVLHVVEDPRLDQVADLLPGTNCGACGAPGCRAFAEQLVAAKQKPAGCTVSSAEGIEQIAEVLGVDAGAAVKRVARLHCGGSAARAVQLAPYQGAQTCAAAAVVGAGGKACSWGCLGLADCEVSCDFDAIHMSSGRLPIVNPELCTACGDCVAACPRDLFEILPLKEKLIVQCAAPLVGEQAMAVCRVACDACGRCAADAPDGLVVMKNGLPVVDYERGSADGQEAIRRCPTGAIAWVVGQQGVGERGDGNG